MSRFTPLAGLRWRVVVFGLAMLLWTDGFGIAASGEIATAQSLAKVCDPAALRYVSPLIDAQTPGHTIEIDVDIAGARYLTLAVISPGRTDTGLDAKTRHTLELATTEQ